VLGRTYSENTRHLIHGEESIVKQQFEGRTEEVANNFLGSEFWEPGVRIAGKVLRKFESVNGECYAIELAEPVTLGGEPVREVALGNLKGLHMALQSAGIADLEVEDKIELTCTGLQPTGKGNPRIDFDIKVQRSAQ
jgi:hypothetical protein